jgi:hypothetical protein
MHRAGCCSACGRGSACGLTFRTPDGWNRLETKYLTWLEYLGSDDPFGARHHLPENAHTPKGAPDNQPTSTAANETALKALAADVGRWRWKDPGHESDPANLDQGVLALATAPTKQKERDQQDKTARGEASNEGLLSIFDLMLDVALHSPKLGFEVITCYSVLRLCH